MEIWRQRRNFCRPGILAKQGFERCLLVIREESHLGIRHLDASLISVNLGQTTVFVSLGCCNKYH